MLARLSPRHRNRWPDVVAFDDRVSELDRRQEELVATLAVLRAWREQAEDRHAEALAAFQDLARTEGIIPALEPAHALARARDLDAELILVCLSGRGDKDLAEALAALHPDAK